MTNVTATASGAMWAYGVGNEFSSSPTMTNVTATASGADENYGVYNYYTSPTVSPPIMTNVRAKGTGGGGNYGLFNSGGAGPYTILIDRSTFEGSTYSILNSTGFTLRIGATKLAGGAVNTQGTYTCVSSYNGNYVALNSTCQ